MLYKFLLNIKYKITKYHNTYCETGSFGPLSKGIWTDLYWIALYDFQNKYSLKQTKIYLVIHKFIIKSSLMVPEIL